jgi:two-component system OmpR family response regulator
MIEDDLELAELLTEYLARFDIRLTNFDCPELGISALAINDYDLVILDLSLPGIDGTDVCSLIRMKYSVPIIISSARSDIKDKSICFNNGADDYLPKPYDSHELVLRINSLLRRKFQMYESHEIEEIKVVFLIDNEKMEISQFGNVIDFTNAEFHIMEYLISKSGYAVSREELLTNVESIKYESSYKSIDVLISRIRNKIELNVKKPQYIISLRGIGYKLINE